MTRCRTKLKMDLPPNLYENKGYYQYRDQKSGKFVGLGKDKNRAIEFALNGMRFAIPNEGEPLKNGGKIFPSAKEIVAMSKPYKPSSGIYFLILNEEIIYIGQSIDCYRRLEEHANIKSFDSYHIIECPHDDLNELEAAYIFHCSPRLNVSGVFFVAQESANIKDAAP